ncbi:Required for meiotic nuclear division protein 1 [Hypocenomyce scalaris]|nr:Required for meiotic nuclear division protein 1 [Hypocenomyce scalaris]
MPIHSKASSSMSTRDIESHTGDVFIFPSGTLVAWAVPEADVSFLALRTLLPAAENPHLDQLETENLEYLEDPTKVNSSIKGDTIVLGTKNQQPKDVEAISTVTGGSVSASTGIHTVEDTSTRRSIDTVLAKVAFSSGLARSTKLAALESLLSDYFESTRSIPTMLSRGSRLPFTRSFILQKTGQLLSVRAQLNLYSELTDSLPDLFWDSRHELGLEGYYDQVGRALDVGVRIKVLNEKMDYAQEIASVLREQLSEKHGLHLEWIIIALIAVEVGFEIRHVMKERDERLAKVAGASHV